jgi:hypothetical protein
MAFDASTSTRSMTLHILKLCVGATDIEDLRRWVAECRKGRDTLDHVTRMFPRRKAEIVPGGSLYWVIRGLILARQPIASLEPVACKDGIERCRIAFKPQIIPVRPTPRRAFQGWRYLEAADAPPDLARSDKAVSGMPEKLRRELSQLGLI